MLKLLLALALCISAFTLTMHSFDPFCFCPQGFEQQEDLTCAKDCTEGYSKIEGQPNCYKNCPDIDGVSERNTTCVFQIFTRKAFEGSTTRALNKCHKQIGKAHCEKSYGNVFAKCPRGYTSTPTQCKPKKIDCSSYGLIESLNQFECTRGGIDIETSPIMCA